MYGMVFIKEVGVLFVHLESVSGKMAERGGQTTKEYSIIQENFGRIVTSLQSGGVLNQVAMNAFGKGLITLECLQGCTDSSKALDFMINIMRRIELDKSDFFVFINCLSAIQNLSSIADELRTLAEQPGNKILVLAIAITRCLSL